MLTEQDSLVDALSLECECPVALIFLIFLILFQIIQFFSILSRLDNLIEVGMVVLLEFQLFCEDPMILFLKGLKKD